MIAPAAKHVYVIHVYGLVDAPRMYTQFFKSKVERLDWVDLAESILIRRDNKGKINTLMIMHVDDICCAVRREGEDVGLTIGRERGNLYCDQSNYITNLI
eukprot:GHVR01161460.1.p1 GENE.GHVR01161460.1~~GHVR01161460.1.p1  ORF type:complete len:100 (-),score=4.78 GHVR01161460.1:160-459(-)